MKKFIIQILIFSALFFLLEKGFIFLRDYLPSKEIDKRLERIINGEINKDLVIFGSSRGARNLVASQISDSLDIDCFNLSYPGSNIEFHTFLLENLIKFNEKPKTVILLIDHTQQVQYNTGINFRLDRLYPLIKYPEIRDELVKREGKNWLITELFIINQLNKSSFNLKKRNFTAIDTMLACGSMPISYQKPNCPWEYDQDKEYDRKLESKVKIASFKKFQKLCKDNGIHLLFVFSPNYSVLTTSFIARIKELSSPEVDFYQYDNLEIRYLDTSYYYDETHLKNNGAEVFTNEIIAYLKKRL